MPFIPHTEEEVQAMLSSIGKPSIESLFCEIPHHLKIEGLKDIPRGLSEFELNQAMSDRLEQDTLPDNYAGGGAYEHHIPAMVWDLVMRGEFLTAYTPYQAEASQGTLQCLWEFQTMMSSLMGHEVSNASLYDGATALVEAILMSVRLNRKEKEPIIFVPDSLNPNYKKTLTALLEPQGIELAFVPYAVETGHMTQEALDTLYQKTQRCTALIIPQPNYFGVLEETSMLTDWAHDKGARAIAQVNPMAMALLQPPGQWGKEGADIACGEGQPLGVPLNRGGPYFGFLTCRQEFVRQLPGRLVGETVDRQGRRGFALTLQAREQHIRRGKATSNICTNQGLLVTAATLFMSVMGPNGLKQVATVCHQQAKRLADMLVSIPNVTLTFSRPYFHEIGVHLPKKAEDVVQAMLKEGIFPGIALSETHPEIDNTLLVCVTETKSDKQLEHFCQVLQKVLEV